MLLNWYQCFVTTGKETAMHMILVKAKLIIRRLSKDPHIAEARKKVEYTFNDCQLKANWGKSVQAAVAKEKSSTSLWFCRSGTSW